MEVAGLVRSSGCDQTAVKVYDEDASFGEKKKKKQNFYQILDKSACCVEKLYDFLSKL